MRKLFIFLLLLACVAAYGQAISKDLLPAVGSGELSPVKFGGKKLPSWLNSEHSPIFNGVNQYAIASSTSLPAGNAARTIMFWVNDYFTGSTAKAMFAYGTNVTGNGMFTVSLGASRISVELTSSKSWYQAYTRAYGWQHLAISYPGTQVGDTAIYRNGVALAGKTYLGGLTATEPMAVTVSATTSMWLSSYPVAAGFPVVPANVSMAELSIWNRALSQDEILRYKDKRLKGTETGLVALYHMNDNSQVLQDSVSGKNAIASNSVVWTKRNGYAAPDVRSERYALSFDGVDDYASGTSTISTWPITLESWVFIPNLTTGKTARAISIASSTNGQEHFATYFTVATSGSSVSPGVGLYSTAAGADRIATTTFFPIGTWQHIAASYDGAFATKLYANGVLVRQDALGAPLPYGTKTTIGVGANLLSTKYYGTCKVAEVRIWNTARTQAEIQANLYTQMTGSETGLVYYYRGSEGSSTTLNNLGSAGASGNLTLYNSPTWVGRDIP